MSRTSWTDNGPDVVDVKGAVFLSDPNATLPTDIGMIGATTFDPNDPLTYTSRVAMFPVGR